jgi:flagellar hook assembly protein FlgD
MPSAPKLDQALVLAGTSGTTLKFDGTLANSGKSLVWMGDSAIGSPVSGGVYTIKIDTKDVFGKTSSYSLSVNVIEAAPANEINIYNSAGELVYHQALTQAAQVMTDLDLKENSFAPAFDSNGVALSKITGQLRSGTGAVTPWSWDGRTSSGLVAQPGVYSIQLVSQLPGQGSKPVLRQIQVLGAVDLEDAAPKVLLTPPGSKFLTLYFKSTGVVAGQASLYNMAGELVGQVPVDRYSGKVEFETGRLAAGVYLAEFEYVSPSGSKRRVVLKAAILQ